MIKRVLVVEDRTEGLYLMRVLLAGAGWKVEEARHGAEALVKARQSPPDLLVTDLLMPVMDGYTLLRHWKSDPHLQGIPFVVYTATYTTPSDEALALDLGADAFVLKPAEPAAFVARLAQVMAASHAAAPATRQPKGDPEAVRRNYESLLVRKLEEKLAQLEATNRELEADIAERRRAEAKVAEQLVELRRWHRTTIDHEGRVLELKREVNGLLAEQGRAPRYPSAVEEPGAGSLTQPPARSE